MLVCQSLGPVSILCYTLAEIWSSGKIKVISNNGIILDWMGMPNIISVVKHLWKKKRPCQNNAVSNWTTHFCYWRWNGPWATECKQSLQVGKGKQRTLSSKLQKEHSSAHNLTIMENDASFPDYQLYNNQFWLFVLWGSTIICFSVIDN